MNDLTFNQSSAEMSFHHKNVLEDVVAYFCSSWMPYSSHKNVTTA